MFGNKSVPSRIYAYGCKSPHQNLDTVTEQFRLAHRYRNRLVELELQRREQVEAALRGLFPELVEMDDQIAELDQQITEIQLAVKASSAKARKRSATAEQREAIKQLKADRKSLYAARKALRTESFASLPWKERQATIEADHTVACKAARAECGLYWGTYLTVEQSMQGTRSGAPPRFMPWGKAQRNRRVAVQIQGGMSWDDATSGEDNRLRIEPLVTGSYRTTPRRQRVLVSIRIGTDADRQPIWTTVRATIHRPIPDGALIKWVYLQRRLVACSEEWQVQFVISHEDGFSKPDQSLTGEVGIDVGWRLVPDGLRVAYWVGSDGKSGQLIIPTKDLARWERVETLQAQRDLNFNAMKDQLAAWLKTAKNKPAWLIERAASLHQWRSQARLAALAIYWRDNRFGPSMPSHGPRTCDQGDTIFDTLEAWRKQDRHLYEWQEHQRSKSLRWRDDLYRNFAADMRRQYHVAHIEDCNWSLLQKRAEPEAEESGAAMREYMRIASVGRLLEIIRESMAEVVPEPTAYTTKICHNCGDVTRLDAAVLYHTCEHCGAEWDQDRNAAINLLGRASAPVPAETP